MRSAHRLFSWSASGKPSRFSKRVPIATSDYVFALVKPYDYNDSFASHVSPFRVQRKGPERHSLLCVRADSTEGTQFDGVSDSSFASAADLAEGGQTVLKGGNMWLSMPSLEQLDGSSVRGPQDHAKLQPGAVVTINTDLYGNPFAVGFFASAAALSGNAGQGVLDHNPNPMQAIATVEAVESEAVDVLVPGVYAQQWSEAVRLLERGEGWYRANVDIERVVAHTTFRDIQLTSELKDVRNDVCLLWPEPLALDEVTFVDAATGALLSESALRARVFRRLVDGEVALHVKGQRVRVLDPTLCVMPSADNVKGMVLSFGGCVTSLVAFLTYQSPLAFVGMLGSIALAQNWHRVWESMPGATKRKFLPARAKDEPKRL